MLLRWKSRESSNVTKGMQQYLFVSKTRIKGKTFQFASLPKIYLISEMKAEPDLSLVWDELVRYKWAYKSM